MIKTGTNVTIIRQFIRDVDRLGYEIYDYHRNCNNSIYVDIQKKNGKQLAFCIRFSNHILKEHNQVPAGVINECYRITDAISTLHESIAHYECLTAAEINGLWQNRPVNEEYDYLSENSKVYDL